MSNNKKRKLPEPDSTSNTTTESKSKKSRDSFNEDEEQAGIIQKITLKNFMCHDNLEYEFHPSLNFILGRNGSGKSAIMMGVILALGGKSHVTGRNSKMVNFIKTGKQVATLEITLKNTGPDAYEPGVFGPRIVIERKITSDGTSSYKLKGDGGKLVSTKSADLKSMLTFLNIQIDNPVSLLTQQTSKTFMQQTTPREKYELFYKATCLEQVMADYQKALKDNFETANKLREKEEILTETKKELDKIQEELKRHLSLDKQRARIKELENTLPWTHVIEIEQELENINLRKATIEKATAKYKKDVEDLVAESQRSTNKVREQEIQRDQFQKDLEEIKKQRVRYNEILKKLKSEKIEYQGEIARKSADIDITNQTIEELERNIQEITTRSGHDIYEEQQRKLTELNQLDSDLKVLDVKCAEKRDLTEQTNANVNEIKTQLERSKHIQRQKKYFIDNKVEEIDAIKLSQQNHLYRYGKNMPELLKRIDEAHRRGVFKKKPIGPVGLYVKVTDAQWLFPVEVCLNRTALQTFCVDNVQDAQQLYRIMEILYRGSPRPQVNTSKFLNQVHDISEYKVKSNYRTVFDLITTNEPVVMNFLIDKRNIESILLIEKSEDAINLMMDHPPKYCSSTYVKNGDQVYPSPKYRYYSEKSKKDQVPFLKSCTDEDIRSKNAELVALQNELQAEKKIDENHVRHLKQLLSQNEIHKNEFQTINQAIAEKLARKQELSVPEAEQDVSTLHKELLDFQRQKQELEAAKKASQDKLDIVKANFAEGYKKCQELHNNYEEKQKEHTRLTEILHNVEEKKEKLKEKIKRKKRNQLDEESNLEKEIERIHVSEQKLQAYKEKAELCCPRIDSDWTVVRLERTIQQEKAVLKKHEGPTTKEAVLAKCQEKKKRYDETKKELEILKKRHKKIEASLKKKLLRFENIRNEISVSAQYLFTEKAMLRNYDGQLILDNEHKAMHILVDTSQSEKSQKREVHTLSGGERSFTLVTLLLSLWEVIESPFRILDEYDVFMDTVNRHTSMKTMIENAQARKTTQYIFLTPLELSQELINLIGGRNNAMIRKLDPPVRINDPGSSTSSQDVEMHDDDA